MTQAYDIKIHNLPIGTMWDYIPDEDAGPEENKPFAFIDWYGYKRGCDLPSPAETFENTDVLKTLVLNWFPEPIRPYITFTKRENETILKFI